MKHINTIVFWAFLMMALPLQAAHSYFCDFENEADRARWILNPTANQNIYNQLANKWYIGEPGNDGIGGHYGLYISDDGGKTSHYSNNGCWVFAYDTLTLDPMTTAGNYVLSFDYCGMGNVASDFDGLYVFWIPVVDPDTEDSVKVRSIASSSGKIPSVYENYIVSLQPKIYIDYVNGTSTWKQCYISLDPSLSDGKPHYLAFVWTNGGQMAQQPGGMIDNIAITDDRSCGMPSAVSLSIQGTTCTVSWQGDSTEYEVSAYSYPEKQWYGPKIVTGNEASFSNLPIGQTDFIVRTRCAEDLYSLKESISKLVYYPDQMCVDYLNLENAVCYTGTTTSSSDTRTFNSFVQGPAVDDGPSKMSSRHTIHFDKNEREQRTGGLASTVPAGELASVRLGNWDKNCGTERIEFSFDVDTMQYPVLLLKYLPILEAPGHDDADNPRFKLDILVGGKSIGECGKADFNCNDVFKSGELLPGAAEQGWHITSKNQAQTSADIVWKEWTTVGVNLKNPLYQGKKLTARLTTFDCTQGAHCGYAYFTLGCSDGKLKGMKCGEINPLFEAPDGFNYRWAYASSEKYRLPDGTMPEEYVLGHEQTFEAGMKDDSLYVVDCMFVQDSSCFFSLYASTLATNPVAVMNTPKIIKNCPQDIYKVQFDASPSWVQEIDHVTNDTLVSQISHIDHYEWTIEGLPGGWSDEVAPTFDFPRKGGKYNVTLRTTCGVCDSVLHYTLELDSLGPTKDTVSVYLCDDVRKAGYHWQERPDTVYHDYGMDSVVLTSKMTSCDSVIYLQLLEPERLFTDTLVLPEHLPFAFHGRSYSANILDTIPNAACDTTWIINFEVYESLLAHMADTAYVLCEGDGVLTLAYDITRGRSLRYSYRFADPTMPAIKPVADQQKKGHYEIPIAINPALYPNVYEGSLVLEDSIPKWNVTIPFTLTMQYASSVIAQRWNDVLAVRNSDYNGGYEFDSVQWYVNGKPIEGATDFNYYTGGASLQFGQPYTALLTRKDGVKLFTCPLVPTPVAADVTDMPSLVPLSAPLLIQGRGTAYWYDMLGNCHSAVPYDNSTVNAPAVSGSYLLLLQASDARRIHHILVHN